MAHNSMDYHVDMRRYFETLSTPTFLIMTKALKSFFLKITSVIFFAMTTATPAVYGQIIVNPSPDFYSVPMKRMLVQSVGSYANQITQGVLDQDSAVIMVSKIYKLNRLLAYNEDFDGDAITQGMVLINNGQITACKKQLTLTKGDEKIKMSFELAAYYLHKAGKFKKDLDSGKHYIDLGFAATGPKAKFSWVKAYQNLYANYYEQSGSFRLSQRCFETMLKDCTVAGDNAGEAVALAQLGRQLPYNSPAKIELLTRALDISRKNGLRILEIQVFRDIFTTHFVMNNPLADSEILMLVKMEKAIGYRHQQYVYDVLAFMAMREGKKRLARSYADETLRFMKVNGDHAFSPVFYQRMGDVVSEVLDVKESMPWFNLALEQPKTDQNRVFWYKSFITQARNLLFLGQTTAALQLIKKISSRFPPTNDFDRMSIYCITGQCYDRLGLYREAEKNYNKFLLFAATFPAEFSHGEFPAAYLSIANMYFNKGRLIEAKQFLRKAESAPHGLETIQNREQHLKLAFKLDSSDRKYLSAIKNYQSYKLTFDTLNDINEGLKYKELQARFASVKKDNDIKMLTKNNELQSSKLKRDKYYRNMTLGAVAFAAVIALLLYYLYRSKMHSNIELQSQQLVLERLIKEKEWLIREIHHRVKNNLHTIVSLLESQSAFLNNDDAQAAVRDSQHRVHAMSLIHQKLYMGNNMQTINAADYIKELLNYLVASFKVGGHIIFETDIESINLDVALAIPLGLIINEAVTNAIKYAFDQPGGTVSITLRKENNNYLLEIRDDGVGLPDNFDINQRLSSLGMTLMKGLSKEIGAGFKIDGNQGTTIGIRFPPYKFSD